MHTFKGFHVCPLFILMPLKCHLCYVQKFPGCEHSDQATFGGFGLTDGLLSGLANSSLVSRSCRCHGVCVWAGDNRASPQLLEHSPGASESGGGKSVCREEKGGKECGRESIWATAPVLTELRKGGDA